VEGIAGSVSRYGVMIHGRKIRGANGGTRKGGGGGWGAGGGGEGVGVDPGGGGSRWAILVPFGLGAQGAPRRS